MLDISADIVNLTAALVDIPSESRQEQRIADAVESALRQLDHVQVTRFENSVVARTELGRDERVVIAGHLDTVPAADNLPHRIDGDRLYGLGSNDMKGGVAVGLRCAHEIREPRRDVTYVFYECEEIDDEANGLRRLVEAHPDLLSADFAVLMEPSDAGVEAGCQGTLRAHIRTSGERAHSARSWLGRNAIHAAGDILHRLEQYAPRTPTIDGLTYREGMNAVGIEGGVATNVIPDACVVTVNYRYAPDRSPEEAEAYMREFFDGYPLEIVDNAQGALPGLSHPAAQAFLEATGSVPRPKFGWTDVSRFSALGVPAVNFGPGDPALAHTRGEYVPIEHLHRCEQQMLEWLR
ncbi:MAG: succinyl-diaminopimelate desuccinylase [Actinobacteria bacterium]|nr:succinyl-diaminopimelate desuccinylase [Actinomycetota bacterium]MCB8997331.1 succinyl-diaminopimelate desuccinylase [Actinomycetota bacterium]MCB9414119.1 succinyl-diaminopimelate desuccinylase [Actinomycetota bacterium]HRY09573.1 succinyl-diaminopimelate desuccinylase [Candidatus Nanopelagicales bacterium]